MSHAEYVSRPSPVFTKLAVMLRGIPAVQFVLAKFAALLRRDSGNGEPSISKFLGEAPGIIGNADRHFAGPEASGYRAFAAPELDRPAPRENSSFDDVGQRPESRCGIPMFRVLDMQR